MPNLVFETIEIPAEVRKEVTCTCVLFEGEKLKAEVGENELSEAVPSGKQWHVIFNVRVYEVDA